jgi:DNA sulfur modification protein DndB
MTNRNKRKTFPALRCSMGDWFYYVTYLKFSDVAQWIKKTDEIHKSEKLRDMIQREISKRVGPIVEYLLEQEERFFNAIVVGVYGGAPQWYPIEVEDSPVVGSPGLDEEVRQSIGLLVLEGSEKLFAIDGQHRVEAIKKALKPEGNPELESEDIAAIFVAHGNDQAGQRRTRRLFSTLNRYAKPVSKGEIVALDEDDAFAITTRRLVEDFDLLNPGFTLKKESTAGFVLFGKTTPIPASNQTSLTSILALYDITEIIHVPILDTKRRRAKESLKHRRPDDGVLDAIFEQQASYWRLLTKYFPEYEELFDSTPEEKVVAKYRTSDGGHLMFRPLGQKTFARAVRIMMDRGSHMEDAINALSSAPMTLNAPPWEHVLWDPRTNRVNSKGSVLLREGVFLYYVGQEPRRSYGLMNEYRKVVADPTAELPSKEDA